MQGFQVRDSIVEIFLFRRVQATFHVVEGANHMDLYDGEKEVAEAVSKLGPFFSDKL